MGNGNVVHLDLGRDFTGFLSSCSMSSVWPFPRTPLCAQLGPLAAMA